MVHISRKNVLMGELEKRKNLNSIKQAVEKKKYFNYILLLHEDTDGYVRFLNVLSHQQSMQNICCKRRRQDITVQNLLSERAVLSSPLLLSFLSA